VADILLFSVRNDAPRADALAARFAGAGLSTGRLASDADLRSSAAGVLLLSQDAKGSLGFSDVAMRVVRAGKAVIADLADVPRPAFFGGARVFDLSRWQGDPFDRLLDPLQETIQQMLVRELRAQAESWRGISDSCDASAYQNYLDRYGPDGAFSPLAQLRLERLLARTHPRIASRPTTPVAAPAAPKPIEPRKSAPATLRSRGPAYGEPQHRSAHRRTALSSVARTAMMVLPFLVCAALTGTVAFGGGEIRPALGPAQAVAAPLDSPVRHLDDAAPAASAAAPWRDLLLFTDKPAASPEAPPLDLAEAEPVLPPTRILQPVQIPATLALPVPASAPIPEAAVKLEPAALVVEPQLESAAIHGASAPEAPLADELSITAALIAGDDPAVAEKQTAASVILYGPQL
jgi:hypothetical protein